MRRNVSVAGEACTACVASHLWAVRMVRLIICRALREAEANKQKLTPEFLQLSFMTAIANNTKLYFGDKLPSMLLELHQILPALQGQLQP